VRVFLKRKKKPIEPIESAEIFIDCCAEQMAQINEIQDYMLETKKDVKVKMTFNRLFEREVEWNIKLLGETVKEYVRYERN